MARRFVSPRGKGWVSQTGGRAVSDHRKQSTAIAAARKQLRKQGGGELKIQGRNGRIRASDSIPRGNDQFPPRG